MLERYDALVRNLALLGRAALIARLDGALPDLWQEEYLAMPGATPNLLTVTFGDESRASHFCRYLFDHASDDAGAEGAVAQVGQDGGRTAGGVLGGGVREPVGRIAAPHWPTAARFALEQPQSSANGSPTAPEFDTTGGIGRSFTCRRKTSGRA